MAEVEKADIIFPELSYKIVGAAFNVYNVLGSGHKELYYQRALAEELKKLNIEFLREKPISISYNGSQIGKYILDFVVDNKVVVELKVRPHLGYTDIKQIKAYLRCSNLKLAILLYFLKDRVCYRRVLNAETKIN